MYEVFVISRHNMENVLLQISQKAKILLNKVKMDILYLEMKVNIIKIWLIKFSIRYQQIYPMKIDVIMIYGNKYFQEKKFLITDRRGDKWLTNAHRG